MASVKVKNVVFDMGGVLLKWEPLLYARRFADNDEDAALLARVVFGSQEWAWADAGAVSCETVAWTAKKRLPERFHATVDDLVFRWFEKRELIEGMDELIHDLKHAGYGIYVLSNAADSFELYKHTLPGYECFDGIVVSWAEHVVKPDASIYQRLLDRYGLEPSSCLFVDDVPMNVEGARRVGMQGWHFDGDVSVLREALL